MPGSDQGRFDLVASDVPRQAKLALGRKGFVEVRLDRIPRHLLGGEDGLVMRGLREILSNTLAGEPDTRSAEETVQAWYAGHRTRRSAGQPDALGRGGKELAKLRMNDALALEIFQDMAARRTGNEKLRKASKRELRRQLGAKIYAEIDAMVKRLLGPDPPGGGPGPKRRR